MYPSPQLREKMDSWVLKKLQERDNEMLQCGDCLSEFKHKEIKSIYIPDGPDDVAIEARCPHCESDNINYLPTKEMK